MVHDRGTFWFVIGFRFCGDSNTYRRQGRETVPHSGLNRPANLKLRNLAGQRQGDPAFHVNDTASYKVLAKRSGRIQPLRFATNNCVWTQRSARFRNLRTALRHHAMMVGYLPPKAETHGAADTRFENGHLMWLSMTCLTSVKPMPPPATTSGGHSV